MLAFADDAALARLVIAATRIPRRAFALAAQSLSYYSKTAPRVGRAKPRASAAGLLRHLTEHSSRCPLGRQTGKHVLILSLTAFDPSESFGSIHTTCLSALVTDRAMEAWYDAPLHE